MSSMFIDEPAVPRDSGVDGADLIRAGHGGGGTPGEGASGGDW